MAPFNSGHHNLQHYMDSTLAGAITTIAMRGLAIRPRIALNCVLLFVDHRDAQVRDWEVVEHIVAIVVQHPQVVFLFHVV